ncbi:MAG: hypothetical protein V3V13_09880 [Paracoccaceae bacterium]
MARFPYGEFDAKEYERNVRNPGQGGDNEPTKGSSAKAWKMLTDILDYLEDGDPIPPELARWLGDAIKYAASTTESDDKSAAETFTKRLGLRSKGQGASYSQDHRWLVYGGLMDRYREAYGKDAAALSAVKAEMKADGHMPVSDTTLKKWHKKYLSAKIEHGNLL